MQEFNCGKSTISDIRKSKEKILGYISGMAGAKRRKTLKIENYEDVEKATYLWFQQEHARETPISGPGPILCEKALQFYQQLHDEETATDSGFKASKEWLDNFKRWHGI